MPSHIGGESHVMYSSRGRYLSPHPSRADSLLQSLLVNPLDMSKLSFRSLKYIRGCSIGLNLRIRQNPRNITRLLSLNIISRPMIIPRGHEGVIINSWCRLAPLNIPSRQDHSIKVGLHEDRLVLRVPWSSKGTLSNKVCSDGGVYWDELGVVDVDAVFVGESCVGAFPSCDAASAASER